MQPNKLKLWNFVAIKHTSFLVRKNCVYIYNYIYISINIIIEWRCVNEKWYYHWLMYLVFTYPVITLSLSHDHIYIQSREHISLCLHVLYVNCLIYGFFNFSFSALIQFTAVPSTHVCMCFKTKDIYANNDFCFLFLL